MQRVQGSLSIHNVFEKKRSMAIETKKYQGRNFLMSIVAEAYYLTCTW